MNNENTTRSMPVWLIAISILAVALVVFVVVVAVMVFRVGQESRSPEMIVKTVPAIAKTIPITMTRNAVVVPTPDAIVMPTKTGWVRKVYVISGQAVKAGQVVAELQSVEDISMQTLNEYQKAMDGLQAARVQLAKAENMLTKKQADLLSAQIELDRSKAGVQAARNTINKAKNDLETASRDVQMETRAVQQGQRLYDEGAIPRNDLQQAINAQARAIARRDQAQNLLVNAQAEVELASNRVKNGIRAVARAKSDVRQAQSTLFLLRDAIDKRLKAINRMQNQMRADQQNKQQSLLQSPVDGRVTDVSIGAGELVTPAMGVVRIRPAGVSTVQCRATDEDAAKLKAGMKALVQNSRATKSLTGKVVAVPLTSTGGDHRNLVIIAVRDPNNELKLGGKVAANIYLKQIKGVAVPQSAVVKSNGRSVVWTISNRKAHKCPVAVAHTQDDTCIISKGLKVDDLIIVSAPRSLKEGVLVSTVKVAGKKR